MLDAATIENTAATLTATATFGAEKVYLAELARVLGTSVQVLGDSIRALGGTPARADLVAAMDAELVAASTYQIMVEGRCVQTAHFYVRGSLPINGDELELAGDLDDIDCVEIEDFPG